MTQNKYPKRIARLLATKLGCSYVRAHNYITNPNLAPIEVRALIVECEKELKALRH